MYQEQRQAPYQKWAAALFAVLTWYASHLAAAGGWITRAVVVPVEVSIRLVFITWSYIRHPNLLNYGRLQDYPRKYEDLRRQYDAMSRHNVELASEVGSLSSVGEQLKEEASRLLAETEAMAAEASAQENLIVSLISQLDVSEQRTEAETPAVQSLPENFTLGNYFSCFISYSSQDEAFAEKLHRDMQERGLRCWYAPQDMRIGDKILDTIYGAIRQREKLLLILSEHSVRSDWVRDEVERASSKELDRGDTVVFPIRIDDAVMLSEAAWARKVRDDRHIANFVGWEIDDKYREALEILLRDLRRPEQMENA